MAATTDPEEPALPPKRKPDPPCPVDDGYPKKSQKLAFESNSSPTTENIESTTMVEDLTRRSSVSEEKDGISGDGTDEDVGDDDDEEEEDEDEEDYEDDDDDEDDDFEGDVSNKSNGIAQADRKGKGILKDDKGKGKLIEEDEEDDSSEGGTEFDEDVDESELSDDPLAEVDLDNILPSRTRRRSVQPGINIGGDLGKDEDDSRDA